MDTRKAAIIFVHAFIGWVFCAATMWIGLSVTSVQNAQIFHAIGAPIYFALVSLVYFKKFNYTSILQTAVIFTGFVMLVDFFVVALLIYGSLEMFATLLGTWIPFALIFSSTYLTGIYLVKSPSYKAIAQ